MRLLKYAILGLVHRAPITGYDIAREFDRGLVNFWHATHSQIYPELKRLTAEGLLTFDIDTKGDKLEKKRYRITDAGTRDLLDWLSVHEELEPTPKDVFRLKLYFLHEMPTADVQSHLLDQLDKRVRKLRRLEQTMADSVAKNPAFGRQYDASLGDFLVLSGAISREQAYVQWLESCLAHVTQLAEAPQAEPASPL